MNQLRTGWGRFLCKENGELKRIDKKNLVEKKVENNSDEESETKRERENLNFITSENINHQQCSVSVEKQLEHSMQQLSLFCGMKAG